MSYWIVLIVIAAIAQATWNLLLKQSSNKLIFIFLFRITQFFLYIPFVILLWPNKISVSFWSIFLIGTGTVLFHSLYAFLLSKAYDKYLYSIVYPASRGTGILITFLCGWILLNEGIAFSSIIGISLIMVGIHLIFSTKIKQTAEYGLFYILLVGLSIAAFNVYDNFAVTLIPPILLMMIENVGQIFILMYNAIGTGKETVMAELKINWFRIIIAGGCCGLSFFLFLTVLEMGVPISLVAPVREVSIVISIFLGSLFLNEKLNLNKIVGSSILFLGVTFLL